MPKVLIFGAGGVGCCYAYVCEKGGAQVTAVCRGNYDVVKEQGITIDSHIWGSVTCRPAVVRTVAEAAAKDTYDFILVCSKAFPGTAALLKDAVTPGTAIVLAQNGIGIEQEYADLFPSNPIISAVVYLPTTQVRPGHCIHGPLEELQIGTFPADAPPTAKARVQELSDLFAAAGAHAPPFDDIQAPRWIKLAVNAAWNPVTALTLCDDGNLLLSSPEADGIMVGIFNEVAAIASAAGYPGVVSTEVVEMQMDRARQRKKTGGKEPSMLTDIRNGRPIEVEAILGNTARIARELGVEVKYLELLYVLAKARNFQIQPEGRWLPLGM